MKIYKILFSIVIAANLIILSACSTMAPGNQGQSQSPMMNANQSEEGVETQAYNGNQNNFASNNPMCQLAQVQGGVTQHFFFDFDKSDIRPQYMKLLQVQANYLTSHPNTITKITGNTDDRGSREYNIALGWRRAKAVARVLEQYGVKQSQLKLVSYGAEKPVLLGTTEADYQCDRRSDIIYLG